LEVQPKSQVKENTKKEDNRQSQDVFLSLILSVAPWQMGWVSTISGKTGRL